MNKIKLLFSIIALVTCTLVASAQTNIRINYTDHIMAPGTLRVSTSPGPSYDLPKGSGGTFPSDATLFTFDWSHAFYPGWGSNVIVINKSTFDSMPYGSASYFYKGSMFYYEITKQYSISGPSGPPPYDYILSVRVYEPGL